MVKRLLTLIALVALCSCTVHQTTAPSLSGPSEFGLSIGVTASPDSISQDGGSQSSIHVTAHDSNGLPLSGQTFHLDTAVGGSQVDYGTLSARTVVTGADGTAFAIYTAPPAPPSGATLQTCHGLAGTCVSIVATPTGNNFSSARDESVEIRLAPVGVILPAVTMPTAQFATSPSTPAASTPTIFDGSSSCAGQMVTGTGSNATLTCQANGLTITGYQWSFGDGGSGTGATVSHTYANAQSYTATLTVTNSAGGTNTASKAVVVVTGAGPTADFTVSPDAIVANTIVQFNAGTSKAGTGHSIVSYSWNFGEPANAANNTATGAIPTHQFLVGGGVSYTVALTVTDDAGQTSTKTAAVKVN